MGKSRFGPFVIDVRERTLSRDAQPVSLTPKAFDLLAVLVAHAGRLLTKDELLQKVWPDTFVEESNLAYHVFALRKALGDTAEDGQFIETVPRHGYRFSSAVTPLAPGPPGAESTRPTQGSAGPAPSLPAVLSDQSADPPHRTPVLTGPLRWALLGVTATVAIGVSLALQSRHQPARPDPPLALPLLSLPGQVRAPSMSPEGTHVVFTWTGETGDTPHLFLQQIDSGAPLRLTNHPANEYSPMWSPDGRTIAFIRRVAVGAASEIWLMAPLGGGERKLAELSPRLPVLFPPSLTWCPDSSCVIATDSAGDDGPDVLFAISTETRERRQLTFPAGKVGDWDAAISPDGGSLVFRRLTTPLSGAFYRLPLTGDVAAKGNEVRLTDPLTAGKAAWSPNNRDVIYSSGATLWNLDVFGGRTPTRLPFVGQDGHGPVVSDVRSGQQRLVYVRSLADANVWRIDLPGAGVRTASPPVAAVVSRRTDNIPSVSPDGKRIAFLSDRSGALEIWVSAVDGSNPTRLTSLNRLPGFPRWSPDGTRIAFHGDPHDRPDVLVVPADGGVPTVLTTSYPNAGFPSFSRDGQWMYFTVVEQEPRIWKMPASGGVGVQVTPNAGTVALESRDGRDLYYVEAFNRPSALWRLPLAGGPPVKVLDGVVLGNFDVLAEGIYYIDRVAAPVNSPSAGRANQITRLQFYDFGTRQSRSLAEGLGAVSFGLSASADGRQVYFSRIDSSTDELMVVNNYR